MSYPSDKIDFGKIIEEAKRKESNRWIKINEYCKKNRINQIELVRKEFERIKRYNKKKHDKINNSNTSDWERWSLILEDILTTI